MNVRDISKRLLQGINVRVIQNGFYLNSKDKSFRRETENGFIQIFDLLFTKKTEGIYVEPTIRLKSKHIEDIYHQVAKKEPKYFDGTKTLGNNLFKISKYFEEGIEKDIDEKQRYIIEEESDINILVDVISDRFEEYGLKYFEENSSVARIDYLLNKYPRDISIHNWLYPLRDCIGIIAAKLNENPDFNTLKGIYQEEMKEAVAPYKEEFNRLITELL